MKRLATPVWLAALVTAAFATSSEALPAYPPSLDVRMVEENSRGFTLEIGIPAPGREELLVEGRAYARISLPGFVGRYGAGLPDLPVRGFAFAVPRGASVTTRVEVLRSETFTAAPPAPVPTPGIDNGDPPVMTERYEPDAAAYASSALTPASMVAVGPEQGWRFHRVRTLEVSPVQVDATTGSYRVARRLRVHVDFEAPAANADAPAWPRMSADRPEWEDQARRFLVNSESAPLFRTRPRPAGAGVLQGAQGGVDIRVRFGAAGLARIPFDDLGAAGFPAGASLADVAVEERSFDSRAADPFVRTTVSRRIEDQNQNGVFDSGDRLLVYGYDFATRFPTATFEQSRYSRFHALWVTTKTGGGREFGTRSGDPSGAGATVAANFPDRLRLERDILYINFPPDFQALFFPLETTLYWVGPFSDDEDFSWNFTLPDPDPAGSTTLSAVWQGAFPDGAYDGHVVSLDVNGVPVLDKADGRFFGLQTFRWSSGSRPIGGLLNPGGNTFHIHGETDEGLAGSGGYFDYLEIAYDRRLKAVNDRLVFNSGSGTGLLEFAVTGFTGSDILLLDITDPTAPVEIQGRIEDAGGTWTVRFQDTVSSKRTYFAGRIGAHNGLPASPWTLPPDLADDGLIAASSGRDLIAEGDGSDYILLTHPRFRGEFEDLARHREEQGHRVLVCDINDVYDQFGGGDKTAWAIQRFVNQTFKSWEEAPSYLLLAGDANEDYRYDTAGGTPDWIPTMMHEASVPGSKKIRELAGTDTWYVSSASPGDAMLDYIPDMYVGRLPVDTEAEARAVVDKIIAYESMGADDTWRNRGVFVADDQYSQGLTTTGSYCWKSEEGSFRRTTEDVCENIHTLGRLDDFECVPFFLNAYLDTVGTLRRDPGPGDCPTPDGPGSILTETSTYTRNTVTPKLIQELNKGCVVWAYTGHANKNLMTSEALVRHRNRSDKDVDRILNVGKPFIFQGYACHLNEFEYAGEQESGRSIGELLVVAPGRGAVASLASTGYEWLHTNRDAQLSTTSPLFWDLPRDPDTGRPRRLLSETIYFGLFQLAASSGFGNSDYLNMFRTYLVLGDPAMRIDLAPPRFQATVNGEAVGEGFQLLAPTLDDSLLVEATVSDDADVSTLTVRDGETELDGGRVTVTPPDPDVNGLQVYGVSFKTALRLDTYDVTVTADDWSGRPSTLVLPVRFATSFYSGDTPLPPGGENLVPEDASFRITVESPVPLVAEGLQLLVDGVSQSAEVRALDTEGRRWELTAGGTWSGGPHTLGLSAAVSGRTATRDVPFAVPTDALELDAAYFYPNPYENGQGSLRYRLSNSGDGAEITIYSVKGRRVARIEGPAAPGWNAIPWGGIDDRGDPVANGVYLVVLKVRGSNGGSLRHLERVAVTR